jgi:hypothetical protein
VSRSGEQQFLTHFKMCLPDALIGANKISMAAITEGVRVFAQTLGGHSTRK